MISRNNKNLYSRKRLQREFLSWFSANQNNFLTPVKISHKFKNHIELIFPSNQHYISAALNSSEINVSFEWQSIVWDFMACFEAQADHTGNSFICTLCDPGSRETYASKRELWRAHLFEPFLEWVNNKLIMAPLIEIYGAAESVTAVKLIMSKPENMREQVNTVSEIAIIANPLYLPSAHSI